MNLHITTRACARRRQRFIPRVDGRRPTKLKTN